MLIGDSFTVHTPVERLWAFLQDVERIAPCMPGAELTETVDDHTWKGRVHVKFGPVQMTFSGTVTMDERDDDAHRAKLSAKGTEQRGKGAASARVESWLEPAGDDGTRVNIRSDITITGAAAQLSRGLLPDVSKLLTKKFADCLQSTLEQEGAAEAAAPNAAGATASSEGSEANPSRAPASTPRPAPKPQAVGGIGLGLRALWSAIKRFFAKLFGPRDRS
jgi:carbon monoxide dehydrogenase subunit G